MVQPRNTALLVTRPYVFVFVSICCPRGSTRAACAKTHFPFAPVPYTALPALASRVARNIAASPANPKPTEEGSGTVA